MIDMPVHPAADVFPMLDEDALTALENDIKVNGQLQPIMVWNGQVVDGRNRYSACVRAGIKPKLREAKFADDAEAIRFIVSTNIHRRHLTESQRAMIAAELATLGRGRPSSENPPSGGITQAAAAQMMSVGERSVQRAREVREHAPDLAAKVKAGEMKVGAAAKVARERAKVETDPDQAADSVIDATESRHATGDTPRSRSLLTALSKLDDTERTFIRADVLLMLGVRIP